MKRMQRVFGDLDALRLVDGRLDPERKAAFMAHLADDPVETERVALWSRQNEVLRAAFAGVALESVPPALRLGNVLPARSAAAAGQEDHRLIALRRPAPRLPEKGVPASQERATIGAHRHRRADLRMPVTVAVLFGLAALILYVAHGLLATSSGWPDLAVASARPAVTGPTLASRATDAFATYGLDTTHPVEFTAAQTGQLSHWLRQRLGVAIGPADLSSEGWTLLGGRMVPALDSPAAFFIYEDRGGDRLALLVARAPAFAARPAILASADPVATMSWTSGTFAYVIAAARSADWLSRNAEALKDRVARSTPG